MLFVKILQWLLTTQRTQFKAVLVDIQGSSVCAQPTFWHYLPVTAEPFSLLDHSLGHWPLPSQTLCGCPLSCFCSRCSSSKILYWSLMASIIPRTQHTQRFTKVWKYKCERNMKTNFTLFIVWPKVRAHESESIGPHYTGANGGNIIFLLF